MFDIGLQEIIIILIIALIVIGPKKLPEFGRTIGKSLRELRNATSDIRDQFRFDLDDDDKKDGPVQQAAPPSPSAPTSSVEVVDVGSSMGAHASKPGASDPATNGGTGRAEPPPPADAPESESTAH